MRVGERLAERAPLTAAERPPFLDAISSGEPEIAFGRARSTAFRAGIRVGWNKFWTGRVLNGWYGRVVTVEPLRLAALEIEADEPLAAEIRDCLMKQWRGESAAFSPAADCRLRALGLSFGEGRLSAAATALLQRLNLDCREWPIAQRWRWSERAGVALLSDGGREQIKPELAWARAIEEALSKEGALPDDLAAVLCNVEPEADLLLLPTDPANRLTPAAEALVARLEFFGLARRWTGGVKLRMPIGSSPGILIALIRNGLRHPPLLPSASEGGFTLR